jgi:branched-chain amino acid transport system substrate-binding protein
MNPTRISRRRTLAALAALAGAPSARATLAANERPMLLAIDAEFSHPSSTSAQAIQRGARIALDEINARGGVLGRPMALEIRDNRGVPARAVQNVRELAALPDVVAVMTGKFSPAVIECLPVAHELRLPLLAAWSAADRITEGQQRPSYVFRLSLRDEWAIAAMVDHARRRRRAQRLAILVPNTAWGRSSQAAAERLMGDRREVQLVHAGWYNSGDTSLLEPYRKARAAGAQALLLVANEAEGSILLNELAQLPPAERLPVVSHWGVTGGRFHTMAAIGLAAVDFDVVQTYSFIGARDPVAQRVLAALRDKYGVAHARAVESPVGVAHAYDLTHLLAKAIARAASADRERVRDALERLGPHQGLVRRYAPPFTPERHEALDARQVFMAAYERDGALVRAGTP